MEWHDQGIITRTIAFHERSLRVYILTKEHGLFHGILPFARQKKLRQPHQRANLVHAIWQARLSDHVGRWRLETLEPYGSFAISFPPRKLAVLESALALLSSLLPERLPLPLLYQESLALLENLKNENDDGLTAYCRFEYKLLAHLGYGFNLEQGREVILLDHGIGCDHRTAMQRGEAFLPLPNFLLHHDDTVERGQQKDALNLSGYFLEKLFLSLKNSSLPDQRRLLGQV